MLLQNKSARLIIINYKQDVPRDKDGKAMGHSFVKGGTWKLLPAGAPVEVADEACDQEYVKDLIKNGDVIASGQVIDSTAEEVDTELEELREECDLRDIEYRSNAGKETLQKKIDKFDAEQGAE